MSTLHLDGAQQWFPGVKLPRLTIPISEMLWSDNNYLYFIRIPGVRSKYWMSKRKEGPVPKERREEVHDIRKASYMEIRMKGKVYHRDIFPFVFFDVHTEKKLSTEIDLESEEFLDYAAFHEWTKEEMKGLARIAFVETPGGNLQRQIVNIGDWVLYYNSGNMRVVTDQEYRENYQEDKTAL